VRTLSIVILQVTDEDKYGGKGGMILNEEKPKYSEKYLSYHFAQEKAHID
jgi:hypothetical protein